MTSERDPRCRTSAPVATESGIDVSTVISEIEMDTNLPAVAPFPEKACPVDDPGDAIALCGDWHGNIYRALAAVGRMRSKKITTAIHVGDFMYRYDGDHAYLLDELNDYLVSSGIVMLFIDGNHDDHDFLDSRSTRTGFAPIRDNIIHIRRGTTWTWRGKRWTALGGAGSIDWQRREEGQSWWSDEVVTPGQIVRCVRGMEGAPSDVIISHDRPESAPAVVPHRSFGALTDVWCAGTRVMLDQLPDPKVWVFGHYHVRRTDHTDAVRYEALGSDDLTMDENVVVMDTDTLDVSTIMR